MTESKVQNHLYNQLRRKRHEPVVPNVKLWRWECDLVSVTPAGYAVEYEIKRTLRDFRRDRKKRRDCTSTRSAHSASTTSTGG